MCFFRFLVSCFVFFLGGGGGRGVVLLVFCLFLDLLHIKDKAHLEKASSV